jgi:outer membrane protein assembly factor BamB
MPEQKASKFESNPTAHRLAMVVAVVSGLFSLIICILLIANYLQIRAIDPLNEPELLQLRVQLAESTEAAPALVQQVRALDLLARKAFFTSQEHLRTGGQLLLGGMVVFLIALKLMSRWSPQTPMPTEEVDAAQEWSTNTRTKEVIAFSSIALVTAALLAAYLTPLDIPSAPDIPIATEEVAATMAFPDWDAVQLQWPSFRGPGGYGVAHYDTAPTDWDAASGKNIRWKAEVALPGFNSPVVWGGHVFLSGGTDTVHEIYCYDADTGDLRWKQIVPRFPGSPAEPPKVSEDTGHAASTMAVHGSLAFAIFANGDIACYDFDGKQRWGRGLGMPDNHYGHSSSLIAYDDLLFVQYDDKTDPRLMALHAETGEEAWVAKRSKISWSSPALIPTPLGMQLILNSELDVDAYAPKTGALLWSHECLDGEVAPSPAYGANTVFAVNEYAIASAIRLDSSGEKTTSEVIWEWDEILTDISSPVGTDTHFYIATSMGEIVCLDINNGEEIWVEEFDQGFYSSPVLVGGRIYALELMGTMQIFKTGAKFERIGAPAIGEKAYATPAYLDGRIYVRAEKHLYCIEERDE